MPKGALPSVDPRGLRQDLIRVKTLQFTSRFAPGLMVPLEGFCLGFLSSWQHSLKIFTDNNSASWSINLCQLCLEGSEANVAEKMEWWMKEDKHGVKVQARKLCAEEAGPPICLHVIRETSPLLLQHKWYLSVHLTLTSHWQTRDKCQLSGVPICVCGFLLMQLSDKSWPRVCLMVLRAHFTSLCSLFWWLKF